MLASRQRPECPEDLQQGKDAAREPKGLPIWRARQAQFFDPERPKQPQQKESDTIAQAAHTASVSTPQPKPIEDLLDYIRSTQTLPAQAGEKAEGKATGEPSNPDGDDPLLHQPTPKLLRNESKFVGLTVGRDARRSAG